MRDPARIDRMIETLRETWHRHPDQRLGQLVINSARFGAGVPEHALWMIEDGDMEAGIARFGGGSE